MTNNQLEEKQIHVVLFSGGRGAASIAAALNRHPQVNLTVLLNAYDDGLSTGRIRAFIPGMLGPSDVRKNITTLMPVKDSAQLALRTLLEYRLPDGAERSFVIKDLAEFMLMGDHCKLETLAQSLEALSVQHVRWIARYCEAFLDYERRRAQQGEPFEFGDCAIGNIVLAGCYLDVENNFNRAAIELARRCGCHANILNVSDGSNLVLAGLKRDGRLLPREADIVAPQDAVPVEEVFLLQDYLGHREMSELSSCSFSEILQALREKECFPEPNIDAIAALQLADIIIYGPGTQNSSLFPSYLTKGVGEAVVANGNSVKLFIANIHPDHDIQTLQVQELLKAFEHYLSRKGKLAIDLSSVVSEVFVQEPDQEQPSAGNAHSYIPYDINAFLGQKVRARDREGAGGRHIGGQIVDEMIELLAERRLPRLKPLRHMASIVVPVLNEARTLEKILQQLEDLDFVGLGVEKEIIAVDGGSTDGSFQISQRFGNVRCYQLSSSSKGRGAAIRYGISKARGDLLVVFPSDDEYDVRDIHTLIGPIVRGEYSAVFGSRLIKCLDLGANIRKVYGPKITAYALSKYGGMAISILSLLLFNRFVSDPFSTLKAYDASTLRSLHLVGNGVDLETEIIAKLSRYKLFFLEVPVSFYPRSKMQGKKMGVVDGFHALLGLVKWRIRGVDRQAPAEIQKAVTNG